MCFQLLAKCCEWHLQVDCSRVVGQQQQKSDRQQRQAVTGGHRGDWRSTIAAGLNVSSADQQRTAAGPTNTQQTEWTDTAAISHEHRIMCLQSSDQWLQFTLQLWLNARLSLSYCNSRCRSSFRPSNNWLQKRQTVHQLSVTLYTSMYLFYKRYNKLSFYFLSNLERHWAYIYTWISTKNSFISVIYAIICLVTS